MVSKTEKALRVVCSRINDEVQDLTDQGIAKAAAWFTLFKSWDEDGTMTICYEVRYSLLRLPETISFSHSRLWRTCLL